MIKENGLRRTKRRVTLAKPLRWLYLNLTMQPVGPINLNLLKLWQAQGNFLPMSIVIYIPSSYLHPTSGRFVLVQSVLKPPPLLKTAFWNYTHSRTQTASGSLLVIVRDGHVSLSSCCTDVHINVHYRQPRKMQHTVWLKKTNDSKELFFLILIQRDAWVKSFSPICAAQNQPSLFSSLFSLLSTMHIFFLARCSRRLVTYSKPLHFKPKAFNI